jgi:SPP1 family predicted phage head-tail adaptor
MPAPAIGMARDRVQIERPAEVVNARSGSFPPTWSAYWPQSGETGWADVETSGGREFYREQMRVQGAMTHLVKLRQYVTGVTSKMRVVLTTSGQKLNIIAVYDPDGRSRTLYLACAEAT